jgi:predicted aspartyl protease
MISFDYDSDYLGPARPVAEVSISNPDNSDDAVLVTGLLDSGADATMIPVHLLKRIGAEKVDQRRMTDASDLSYLVDIYEVAVRIGIFTIPQVHAIANRKNREVTIGRDVLNYLIVTLNGLAYTVEISQ